MKLPNQFALSPLSIAIIALIANIPIAFADHDIEHITVEGINAQTVSGSTSVISEEDIRRQAAATSDTASLLDNIAGLSLNAAGGLSSLPAIHGLADDRLRVKVNGMDLISSCPNHMNPPLSYLAPTDVGAMTVYVGISPVSVGGDSLGGTVVVDTKTPEFALPGEGAVFMGEFGAFYRHNNQAHGVNMNASYATDNSYLSYGGNWSKADNYTAAEDFKTQTYTGRPGHSLPLDEVGSSAYETQNHRLRLAYQQADNLFDLHLSYQDMPAQMYPNQRMDLLDNKQFNANLAWTKTFSWGELESRMYHERVDHMMDFGPDKQFYYGSNAPMGAPCSPIRYMGDPEGTCAAGMPMHSESTNNSLSVKAEVDLSAADMLRLGVEAQFYTLDDYWEASGGGMGPETFQNINNGQRDRLAIFAEREQAFNDRLMLLYGLRYERVSMSADAVHGYSTSAMAPGMQVLNASQFNSADRDSDDDNLDVTIAGRYHSSEFISAEAGYSLKVRSPNLYEKYTWSYWAMAAAMNNLVGDGNGYVGNVNLVPEKAHTLSASFNVKTGNNNSELTVSPYYTYVDDYIDAISATTTWAADQFNVLTYANQSARIYGLDITGNWHLAHNDSGHWQLNVIVSATHSENKDTGNGLYQVIPLQSKLTLTHELNGWQSKLVWQLVSKKDDISEIRNEIPTAGYGLLNLQTGHQWEHVRVDVGIENLLDKFYINPTGGAYTGQGMTMSLNAIEHGVGVPGMGRSVYAGFTYNF